VERDITGIYDIIHAATCNGNQINLNKLNNILAEQLQRIIGTTTSMHELRKTPATKQHEIEDIAITCGCMNDVMNSSNISFHK
jgi:hypothetical protein